MADDKTEELKIALKKTFNQDNNLKQDFIKQNKAHSDTTSIKNNNKKTTNNLVMYILIFINFILICIVFYVLITKNEANINLVTKENNTLTKQLDKKVKQISKIKPDTNKEQNKNDIKQLKDKHMKQVTIMNEEIKKLKRNHTAQSAIMNEKIKLLENKKGQNISLVSRSDVKKLFHSKKFKLLKCYKSKKGSNILSKNCKDSIKKFISKYKDLARFEIIGVIAKDDDVLYNKLNTNNLSEDLKKIVKEYLLKGLARERVLEAFWHIKEVLKSDIIMIPTNYYVKSLKESKGILIKAYY